MGPFFDTLLTTPGGLFFLMVMIVVINAVR
jgi:hypothetical protein